MNTKVCGICKREKPVSEFHRRGNGYKSWCKECNKEYDRQYYKKNREKRTSQKIKREKETREWLNALKAELECGCGESHPACLEFHHRDRDRKNGTISEMAGHSREAILREIKKCDVLCANCHRKLHYKEGLHGGNIMVSIRPLEG